MKYKIPKGAHRARPPLFGLWICKSIIQKQVCFTDSCRYDLPGADQFDTNKLFGIGYLFNHHVDSARFGWLWNPVKQKIEIAAYCYIGGERIIKTICEVDTNKEYVLKLRIVGGSYVFSVKEGSYLINSCTIPFSHKKKFGYPLGVYFGGSRKAPHSMAIEMKNV